MSEIVFVTLPGAGDRLSVLVVPRLDGSLADGGMDDWVARLSTASLSVEADPGGTAPATPVGLPDPALWRSVFPPETRVEPYAEQRYGTPVVEPSATLLDRISATYAGSAKAVAGGGPAAEAGVQAALAEWTDAAEPPAAPGPAPAAPPPAPTGRNDPDFHTTVSLLREHPVVLRALGLIFDVDVPEGLLAGDARVRVTWPGEQLIVSPWTAMQRSDRGLSPAASGDIARGMVDLSTPEWVVGCVDVQAAAGRLRDAARAVATDGTASLPTLRSLGMSLMRRDRAAEHARRGEAAAGRGRAALDEATFAAEDLVLGYRIDVRRQGSPWRSLTARRSTYDLNGTRIGDADQPEEGQVKAHAAVRDQDGTLRSDEIIARWDGWSLAVPRTPPASGARSARTLPFDFTAAHSVPEASLPELRFGEEYRMRVRVADLVGGGPDVNAPEADEFASPFTSYRRFEPVGAPELSTDDAGEGSPFGPGEALDELVIRSDRGMSVAQFSAAHPSLAPTVLRRLGPPQTSLRIAEEHGALDRDDAGAIVEAAALQGTLADPAAGGVLLVVADGTVATGASIDQDWSGAWPSHPAKTLRLTADVRNRPRLEWVGAEATVRLGQAEQVTLAVSSFLANGIVGHFEIAEWLRELPATAVTTGRHPMATPPRRIRLVHAVRKPLADPSGTLDPQRSPGATHATLVPSVVALGANVASTGQIDLAATWDEWSDAPDPVAVTDTMPSLTLPLGGGTLPEIRHEFADTKHRRVSYRATAVSRFRRYFDPADDDAAFVAATTLPAVEVPSTARPPRPVVRSVTPSFRWQGTDVPIGWTHLERVRAAGRLRVELDRPWYETGEGEQLAVLVWDGASPPQDEIDVTRAGRDPIRSTSAILPFPPLSAFGGSSGPVFRRDDIAAVPYDVWFAEGSWWTDIQLPTLAAASYSPFVRLAVARYQAHSLEGLQLSDPVTTDPAPVLPDRALVLDRTAGSVSVTLKGAGPRSPGNMVRATLERSAAAGAAAELSGGEGADGVAGWTAVQEVEGALGETLALAVPSDDSAYRVVVREAESIAGDGPSAFVLPELARRTVFVDAVPLI